MKPTKPTKSITTQIPSSSPFQPCLALLKPEDPVSCLICHSSLPSTVSPHSTHPSTWRILTCGHSLHVSCLRDVLPELLDPHPRPDSILVDGQCHGCDAFRRYAMSMGIDEAEAALSRFEDQMSSPWAGVDGWRKGRSAKKRNAVSEDSNGANREVVERGKGDGPFSGDLGVSEGALDVDPRHVVSGKPGGE